MSGGASVLTFEHVFKKYGDRQVLNDISLFLREGECLALLGPNGAGKSTIIQLALGLAEVSSGAISLLDSRSIHTSHLARADVGVVPQYDGLDPDFTVRENLIVFGSYFDNQNLELEKRADALLQFSALFARSSDSVASLSGGMRRRLALARALINNPKVLFLDEPTTALDPQAKHLLWERLVQLKRQGLSLFLTTHYMDEAQRLADRVVVIDQGKMVAAGSPAELIERHVAGPVLEVWGIAAPVWMSKLVEHSLVVQRGETYFASGDQARRLLEQLSSVRPKDVEYLFRPSNLEDVFFHLTGRDLRDV
jgi:lipooligosaccharide transport system ATP-binding protein